MIRFGVLCSVLMACAALSSGPAAAEARLAIGAAGGVILPEGAVMRPVYTYPRGTRWDPVDVGEGYRFREPIYTTPRGYRYIYVRGYEIIPARKPRLHRVAFHKHRTIKTSVVRVKKTRHRGCVTDLGFGRYEVCL